MTTRNFTLPVLLAVTLFAAGCGGDSSSGQGRVAILDMQKVATATEWDVKINAELHAAKTKLDQSLTKLNGEINADLTKKKDELGDNPTDEQRAGFIKAQQAAQDRFNDALSQSESLMRQRQAQLLGQFRDEVKPFASRTADALGFKIVMVSGDAILTCDSRSDITDAVIAAMLQAGKKYTAPETPATPQAPAAQAPAPDAQPGEAAPTPVTPSESESAAPAKP